MSEFTREHFFEVLKNNKGVVIFKFGASWCQPCKYITPLIHAKVSQLKDHVTFYELDVDDSFDIYGYLQSKKMVNGIPALLGYVAGNESYVSDFAVSGTNKIEIDDFFNKANSHVV